MGSQVSVVRGPDGQLLEKHALKESYSTSNLLRGRSSRNSWGNVRARHQSESPKRKFLLKHSELSSALAAVGRPNDQERESHFFLSPITSNDSQIEADDEICYGSVVPEDDEFDDNDSEHLHHNLQSDFSYATFKIHPSEHDLLNPIDTLLQGPTDVDDVTTDVSDHSEIPAVFGTVASQSPPTAAAAFSPLLSLPLEILYRIVEIVYSDDEVNSINDNLENFSNTVPLLSRKLHQLSLCFLYKYAIFNRPHSFDKFLTNLNQNRFIGKYVEFMDFEQFTSIGLGRTGRMNQEIEMVTSRTITQALSMTTNLIEFLASENIQDDMDVNVLDYLFNRLYKIQAIDFCGASSNNFTKAFLELIIDNDIPALPHAEEIFSPELSPVISPISPEITPVTSQPLDETMAVTTSEVGQTNASSLSHLYKLSFHDCSSLTPEVFIKVLPHLHYIRRLDLTHTQITSAILNQLLPHTCRLTHLSLSRCSKLTTKDLINFLIQHPAVANDTLRWLNLQIDSNVVSPLSDIYLIYTLKHLKASQLEYLNLSGLPCKNVTLQIIKARFKKLKSLSLGHSNLSLEELNDIVSGLSNLRYIELSGLKLSRYNIISFLKEHFNSKLEAVEFDYKSLYEATANGNYLKVEPRQISFLDSGTPQVWKFYDNEGRRAWIYKLAESDPECNRILYDTPSSRNHITSNLTYYDMETGKKIVQKVKQPSFLKYGSRKINCSIGYKNLRLCKTKHYAENIDSEYIWPPEFSQRGIYNYYSLNIK